MVPISLIEQLILNAAFLVFLASRDEPLRQQNAGLGHPHHYRSTAQPSSSSATLRISPDVAALLVPGLEDGLRDVKEGGNRPHVSKRASLNEDENGQEVEEREIWSETLKSLEYLPGPDLEPRRKPVSLPASTPCFIYNLDPEDIEEDLQQINNALKVSSQRIFYMDTS